MAHGVARSLLTEYDVHLFRQGRHYTLYDKLGVHIVGGGKAARFAVWAPNAARVSVIGDFNQWRADAHPLAPRIDGSGIWEDLIPGVAQGQRYKYRIESRRGQGTTVSVRFPRERVVPRAGVRRVLT